jgi:response regulator NasT
VKKILVGAEDKMLLMQIDRILKSRSFAYEVASSLLSKEQAARADLLIVHSSWRLPSLQAFIEHLVLAKVVPLIYVAPTISTLASGKLTDSPYFLRVHELRLDAELPIAVDLALRFASELKAKDKEIRKLQNRLEEQKLITNAKRALIEKGMSEADAHQRILKVAMDHQMTKAAACLKILKENEPASLQSQASERIISEE